MRLREISAVSIAQARGIIDPIFLNSPLISGSLLDQLFDAKLFMKLETLNPIRSFKGRGASYFFAKTNSDAQVVTASAGNFGQAIAWCAKSKGLNVTVFASLNANPLKIDAMRRFGATVEQVGEDFDTAKLAAQSYAEKIGAIFIEDGAHPEISEGAGTIAAELTDVAGVPDIFFVPLGNGALAAGIAVWLKHLSSQCKIIGVVASGAPSMRLSFLQKKLVSSVNANTIADGIAIREPVEYATRALFDLIDEVVEVDDPTILHAMHLLQEKIGVIVEPAGAAGVAAIINKPDYVKGRTVGTVLCGGNVTPAQFSEWFASR